MQTKKNKALTYALILGMSITTITSVVAIATTSKIGTELMGAETVNRFVFNADATATDDGFKVYTAQGNEFDMAADGVTISGTAVNFAAGATLKNVAARGVKGINSITFDVNDGSSFVLRAGTAPEHLVKTYVVNEDETVTFDSEMSYFEISSKEAASLNSVTFNYACVTVSDPGNHVASGMYTTEVVDGTVEIHEKCENDGLPMGAAVATMAATQAAGIEVNTTERTNPWTYDEETKEWTSCPIGDGASSYVELHITKSGVMQFSYDVSAESSDKLHLKKKNASTDLLSVGGKGATGSTTGTFTANVVAGEVYLLWYQKDPSVSYGRDNAIVKFADASFTYHALTLVTEGGSKEKPMFIENGTVLGTVPTPTHEGKFFEGWYIDAEYETAYTNQTFDDDACLYAKWSDPVYITLHSEGQPDQVLSVQVNKTPTIADPTKEGYEFQGWYTDAEFQNAYVAAAATEDFELYAKWFDLSQAHALYGTYTNGVYCYLYSGWSSASVSTSTLYTPAIKVDVDGSYTVRKGYSSNLTGSITSYDKTTGAMVLSDGSKAHYDAVRDAMVMIDLANFAKEQRVFVATKGTIKSVGNSAFNSSKLVFWEVTVNDSNVIIMIDGANNTFYYDVSFVDLAGNAVERSKLVDQVGFTVKSGSTDIATYYLSGSSNYSSTQDGYAGVYTAADGETIQVSGAGKCYFSKIKSSYSSTMYLASYEAIAGEEDGTMYVSYSSSDRYVVVLNKEDHTFTYKVRTVTITYDLNYEGAPAPTTDTWTYAIWTDLAAAPTRDGYEFDGWYTDAEGGTKTTRASATADTTYYAHWLEKFTVSFVEADGTPVAGVEAIQVTSGKAIGTLPTPTAKEGYDFDGWYLDSTFTTAATSATVVTENMNIYAHWTTPATVTLHYVGGTTEASDYTVVSAQKNRVLSVDNPSVSGKAFLGWYTDADCTVAYDTSSLVTGDMDLYAKWMEAHSLMGTYKGFNLYSTGNQEKTNSSLSTEFSVAADGTFSKGTTSYGILSGESGVVSTEKVYVYYDGDLDAIWAPYSMSNTSGVGTDTYLAFRNSDKISKINFVRYGSSYTFGYALFQITYTDGTTQIGVAKDNVLYGKCTIEGVDDFSTITNTTTGITVKDKAGNVIYSL